jgi:hypothetical protein
MLSDVKGVLEYAKRIGMWETMYSMLRYAEVLIEERSLNDMGRLSSDESFNHARLVVNSSGKPYVLKLIGQSTSLETECLREWNKIPTIKTYVPELVAFGEQGGFKWNLQEYIENTYQLPSLNLEKRWNGKPIDYDARGLKLLPEVAALSSILCSTEANINLFPDEVEVLESVINRAVDHNDKHIIKLATTLLETRELLTYPRNSLVHGDLHIGNVMVGREGLRAIDPFGLKGSPASDIAKYIALSCRDNKIDDTARMVESEFDIHRFDLGWLIAANLLNRMMYLDMMQSGTIDTKGNTELAFKAMSIW